MASNLFQQVLELLPHLSRMMPLADKYMQGRGARDAAIDSSLREVQAGVRNDLGKVARAHMDLAARLDVFAGHVDEIGAGVKLVGAEANRARLAAELASNHAGEVERQLRAMRVWIKVGTLVIICLLLLLFVLVLREHAPA